MKYANGKEVQVGDRVRLSENCHGRVVCSIDEGVYTAEFSQSDWHYLKVGVLIKADSGALLHYVEADEDLELEQVE